LRVPPFDRHSDGDGQLRGLGLEARGWSRWVGTMAAAELRVARRTDEADAWPATSTWRSRAQSRKLVVQLPDAPSAWNEGAEVGNLLRVLWRRYQPIGKAWTWSQPPPLDEIGSERQSDLWQSLVAYRGHVDRLCEYIVEYPEPVVFVIPPSTVVVGHERSTFTWDVYSSQLSNAVKTLAHSR
jgi:hypothetical protein